MVREWTSARKGKGERVGVQGALIKAQIAAIRRRIAADMHIGRNGFLEGCVAANVGKSGDRLNVSAKVQCEGLAGKFIVARDTRIRRAKTANRLCGEGSDISSNTLCSSRGTPEQWQQS